MKILVAGPGTGKTTKIKTMLKERGGGTDFLILSFTNATVSDLIDSLKDVGVSEKSCMTLHKFAMKYNHDQSRHVLIPEESKLLQKISKKLELDFDTFTDLLSATTFGQMISRFVEFAKVNPEYLKEKLSSFNGLIIDEYQDFNKEEQALIEQLTEYIDDVYILGDDDQCIYNFKNATGDKIIELHKNKQIENLQHEHICYRCPDKIVDAASNLIGKNTNRVDKEWHKSDKEGDLYYSQISDLETLSDNISDLIQDHYYDKDVLILSPTQFITEGLCNSLEEKGIIFSNYRNTKIPKELLEKVWLIRGFFSEYKYLNLVLSSYKLLSNRKKFYSTISNHYNEGINEEQIIKLIVNKIPESLKSETLNFNEVIADEYFNEISDLYNDAKGDDELEKLSNIFESVGKVDDSSIRVMSIHKSKGLGADYVFILGLTEGILPREKSSNQSIEDQRRLLFVGMTRAKKELHLYSVLSIEGRFANIVNKDAYIYSPRKKLWNGKASTFISELELDE